MIAQLNMLLQTGPQGASCEGPVLHLQGLGPERLLGSDVSTTDEQRRMRESKPQLPPLLQGPVRRCLRGGA